MKILTPPLTPPLRWEGMAYGVAPIRLTRENEGIRHNHQAGMEGGMKECVHAGAANPLPS